MDPITSILIGLSTSRLTKYIQDKFAEETVNKVGNKVIEKLGKKKVGQLTVDEYKALISEVFEELTQEGAQPDIPPDDFVKEVLEALSFHSNSTEELIKYMDNLYSDIVLEMDQILGNQFSLLKQDLFSSSVKNRQNLIDEINELLSKTDVDIKKYVNFKDAIRDIVKEYGSYFPKNNGEKLYINKLLVRDVLQLPLSHRITVRTRSGVKQTTIGKLNGSTKFVFTNLVQSGVIDWNTEPPISTKDPDFFNERVFHDLQDLLYVFSKNNPKTQELFVLEILNLFFRLTHKEVGSLVPLSDVIASNQQSSTKLGMGIDRFERALHGFFKLLELRHVELPTPYHSNLKAFEIKPNLRTKLIEM